MAEHNTLGIPDILLPRIRTDSRVITAGDVFVAIGKGHQHIDDALASGAVQVISEQAHPSKSVMLVPDSVIWLGQAAAYYRGKLGATFIGVTGSVGKTSLVQLLKQVLPHGTHATLGNQNNEIGCALTILSTPKLASYVVVEMGVAKHFDMDYLVDMVKPDIAVVTKIGFTHLSKLKSNQAIWKEKSKIALPHTHLICVMPNQHVDSKCHAYLAQATYIDQQVCLSTNNRMIDVTHYHIEGRRDQALVSAMVAVLDYLDLPMPKSWPDTKVASRVQPKQDQSGAIWIDDSYNASLLAYAHAIECLMQFEGKRIMVVGEMGDLGQLTAHCHAYITMLLNQADFDHVIFYGSNTKTAYWSYNGSAAYVTDHQALQSELRPYQSPGHMIWVKGSNHLKLGEVVPC